MLCLTFTPTYASARIGSGHAASKPRVLDGRAVSGLCRSHAPSWDVWHSWAPIQACVMGCLTGIRWVGLGRATIGPERAPGQQSQQTAGPIGAGCPGPGGLGGGTGLVALVRLLVLQASGPWAFAWAVSSFGYLDCLWLVGGAAGLCATCRSCPSRCCTTHDTAWEQLVAKHPWRSNQSQI
jgi:hypothetical protein